MSEKWFIIFTKPRNELKVSDRLLSIGIEAYTPSRVELREWSDRKKKVRVPLLPSMVLVQLAEKEVNKVFEIPGVVRYLFEYGKRAEVSNQEVLAMQAHVANTFSVQENKLVVGSQARILYADAEGRIKIAKAFNRAIKKGKIGPIVLGRDHHDVSGTDSPYRETSNIYDGSKFTADMAIQNVIGDSFRGATWVSIHNGGGVGWGEVINGGFGMLLDGTKSASKRLESMLFWDVNNGISRRSWARNKEAVFAIKRAMRAKKDFQVTLPNLVEDVLIDAIT